jgi:hypothetical protein
VWSEGRRRSASSRRVFVPPLDKVIAKFEAVVVFPSSWPGDVIRRVLGGESGKEKWMFVMSVR